MSKYMFEVDYEIKKCSVCPMTNKFVTWWSEDYFCNVEQKSHDEINKPDWCPLKEVKDNE